MENLEVEFTEACQDHLINQDDELSTILGEIEFFEGGKLWRNRDMIVMSGDNGIEEMDIVKFFSLLKKTLEKS